MSKSSIETKTVLTMTDMTESIELLAFKRQKDGCKVTVKIFHVLFFRETNSKSGKFYLLASTKCTWCAYLSPPFIGINHYNLSKKTNTLTLFIYDFIRPVSCFGYLITQKVIPKRIRLR